MKIRITTNNASQSLVNFEPGQLFREINSNRVWIMTDARNANSIMCIKLSGDDAGRRYWYDVYERIIPVVQTSYLEVADND